MVKFRGVNVNLVSQFDIRKLPEFSPRESTDPFHREGPALHSDDNSVASCYVPTYPGSQIWLEYSIDAPHPPHASYFFKMLHNGQVVTSWDCTAKHGYHGKMAYSIQYIANDDSTGKPLVKRQALKFSARDDNEDVSPFGNYIEIRVNRIEHRQRAPLESSLHDAQVLENSNCGGLCLVNSGLVEPGFPQRRYVYQLLDPIDEPYATIRFYYRSYTYLEDQKIVSPPAKPCRSTSISSSGTPSECSTTPSEKRVAAAQEHKHTQHTSPKRAPNIHITPPSAFNFQVADVNAPFDPGSPSQSSKESLRIIAKDSLEDFRVSPIRNKDAPFRTMGDVNDIVGGSTGITSPKKLQKKSLTLKIDGADFELEKKKRRPLSPFTSAGALRRMMIATPPSAPAAVTEFGPTVAEEVETQLAKEKECRKLEKVQATKVGTTRAERGGMMLLGFLEKRIGKPQ